MNDHTRTHAPAAMRLADLSVQGDEPRLVGENEHAPVGNDWRDKYRRAEIELRLHLATRRIDADELTCVSREPEPAAGEDGP